MKKENLMTQRDEWMNKIDQTTNLKSQLLRFLAYVLLCILFYLFFFINKITEQP